MRVTLAICCYNAQDTIARALRSAQSLQWDDLEILVADDVSTDGSVAIVEEFARNDPRIRLLRHEVNTGNAGTRNTLAKNASGEILAFQDDDDESHPDRIVHQVARLREVEDEVGGPVACYCSRTVVSETKQIFLRAMGIEKPVTGDLVALHLLCGDDLPERGRIGTCTMMARTETLRRYPFDEAFRRAVDREWGVRFALAGGYIAGCREQLVTQHMTVGPDKSRSKQQMARYRIVRKYGKYLKSKGALLAGLLVHRPPQLRFRGTDRLVAVLRPLVR